MADTLIVETEQKPASAIGWAGVLAGAAVACALSIVLFSLGSGLGLSSISPWANTTAPETTKAATVAGIYLTVTAVLASAVGGYLATRLRPLWPGVHRDEAFFRDTAHGLVTWAVATLATAAVLGGTLTALGGGAAKEAAREGALPALTDRLFAPAVAAPDRAAADRILMRLRTRATLADEDRQSLAAMVGARTGLPMPEAERRVAGIETEARNALETARRVGMQLSFWFVAAMLAGALAAGLAAWEGGAIRDGRMRYGRY
jgi:hypothetical protein